MSDSGRIPTDYRLRPRRVGAVGGHQITELNAEFCEALGYRLAQEDGLVIVTGGRRSGDVPAADDYIITGVRRSLAEQKIKEELRLETLIPKGKGQGLLHAGKVWKVSDTRQSRRSALVRYVDALVTIQGVHGTPEMIIVALAFEKPVLPLPFTGGKSEEQWHLRKAEIRDLLQISEAECRSLEVPLAGGNIEAKADLVRDLVRRAVRKRCFVAMPFAEFDEVYKAISGALEGVGLIPVRTDQLDLVGDVVRVIHDGIQACEWALADISGGKPNVFYELGLMHAIEKPTVLICELAKDGRLPHLPFDLSTQAVIGYSRARLGDLARAIRRKLGGQTSRRAGPLRTSNAKGRRSR